MTSSWKIGVISGLVAGIIAAIVYNIVGSYTPILDLLFPKAYGTHIILGIIFGLLGGIIYSKVHYIIPGKGVPKGLIYGLLLLLISWVHLQTFGIIYGVQLFDISVVLFAGFFKWVTYGLVLAFLFMHLHSKYYPSKEEPKIVTYSLISGIIPGAIAGIADGIAAALTNAIASMTGLFGPEAMAGAPDIFTFDFWIVQSGSHIFINLVWGAIIGMIFAKVYNLVPGKGITKGLCYTLMIFVFSTFLCSVYWIGWGWVALAVWGIFVGIFSTWLALGLVLGLLYRKPSE